MPKLALSQEAAAGALVIVSKWMLDHYGVTPGTPSAEFYVPKLVEDFDWSSTPGPALVLELGDEWTAYAWHECLDALQALGIHAEPYSAWALCLYPL